MIKDLYFLLKRVIILLNSFDSAGDKIRSIIKGNKRSERVHNVLLYLLNFEIWGLYEGDERSTLLSRRQSALDELNSICSSILYQIKDFQSHNSNYGKRTIEIILKLLKLVIHYDIIRAILSKKKQESIFLIGKDQVVPQSHFDNDEGSKSKPEKHSINSDIDNIVDKNCYNLNNIEEEKESSYNLMKNVASGQFQERFCSSQNPKKLESTGETRQQTTSVFSRLANSSNSTISQDLMSLFLNEIQKSGIVCSCTPETINKQKTCKFCKDRNEEVINISNRYRNCQPLFQNWNQPSQENIGVLINIKCGHRGNYSDKEREVVKYWLKEGKFFNEDPEFVDHDSKEATEQSCDEEEKSLKKKAHLTPIKKNNDIPIRKMSKHIIIGSPYKSSYKMDQENNESEDYNLNI